MSQLKFQLAEQQELLNQMQNNTIYELQRTNAILRRECQYVMEERNRLVMRGQSSGASCLFQDKSGNNGDVNMLEPTNTNEQLGALSESFLLHSSMNSLEHLRRGIALCQKENASLKEQLKNTTSVNSEKTTNAEDYEYLLQLLQKINQQAPEVVKRA